MGNLPCAIPSFNSPPVSPAFVHRPVPSGDCRLCLSSIYSYYQKPEVHTICFHTLPPLRDAQRGEAGYPPLLSYNVPEVASGPGIQLQPPASSLSPHTYLCVIGIFTKRRHCTRHCVGPGDTAVNGFDEVPVLKGSHSSSKVGQWASKQPPK